MLIRDGRILLAKRSLHRKICPNDWEVVGGHVEPGESIEQALPREAQEEVGITPLRYAPAGTIHYRYPDSTDSVALHFFTVTEWSGGEPTIVSDEHTELRWYTVDEACAVEDLAMEEYRSLFAMLSLAGSGPIGAK